MIVYALGTFMAGAIAAAIWWRDRNNLAFKILIVATIAGIAGIVIHGTRNITPFWFSTGAGFPLVFIGSGLFWCAFAAFEGRRPNYWMALAGAAVSLAITPLPLFQESTVFRAIFAAFVIGSHNMLCAWEVWRGGKREPLPARPLAMSINAGHALLWYARIPMALFLEPPSQGEDYASWFVIMTLLSALNNIFAMFALMLLSKDRSERRYKLASETDMLTGINNRRVFVERSNETLLASGVPAALLMVDIDKFKSINDTYGHAAGDKAIVAFADCLKNNCEDGWIIGRLGGEEFGCLIPGGNLRSGMEAAERLRRATEALTIGIGDQSIGMTVSVGVSTVSPEASTLDALMMLADLNLYTAKNEGRNRVCARSPSDVLRSIARPPLGAGTPVLGAPRTRRSARLN